MKKSTYALYKGDELLGIGTILEIANKLGLKPCTVRFYSSPTYKKRNRGDNHKILFKVEE